MTSVRVFVVAIAAATVLAFAAPAANASAPSKSKVEKFCTAVGKISSADPSGDSTSDSAQALAKTTRKAAKLAPTSKLKGALGDIAKYYDALGDADTPIDQAAAAARLAGSYTKAFGVFTAYYVKNCTGVS
jgi:hypothetical protein